MIRVFIIVAILAGSAHAQVLQISAGDSNIGLAGAGATAYIGQTTQASASVGYINGHITEGLNAKFDWRSWKVNAGDSELFYSTGQLGVAAPLRGAEFSKHDDKSSLSFFVGLTGPSISTQFAFGAYAANKPTAGLRYARKWGAFESSSVIAFSQRKTMLEEGRYHWKDVKLASTVGVLNNAFYFETTATGAHETSYGGFSGVIGHENFIYQGTAVAFNTAGGSVGLNNGASASVNLFQSKAGDGESISAGYKRGFMEGTIGDYRSADQNLVRGTVIEHFHRLSVMQYITRTNTTTVSFGAVWQGNTVTAGVSQQIFFMPLTGKFEQAIGVNVRLQLPHSTTATLQTNMLPTGKQQWLVYGTQYDGINGMVVENTGATSAYSAGKYSVTGTVRDAEGNRIQGMSILVGKEEIFTNGEGEFMVRQKKSESQSLAVNIADALTPGSWKVVSCPDNIQPGQSVQIIVARDTNARPAAKSKTDDPAAPEVVLPKSHRNIFQRLIDFVRGGANDTRNGSR